MEILSTITAIVVIAEKVITMCASLSKKTDKKSYSILLQDIGTLLQSVYAELENNQYPHLKCSQLHFYLDKLKNVIATHDESLAEQLRDTLNEAYQVEKLFGEISHCNQEQKELNLSTLQKAAGTFIAAGVLIVYD